MLNEPAAAERVLFWAAEHQLDDDFDAPLPNGGKAATVGWVADNIVGLATEGLPTPAGRSATARGGGGKSYADAFMSAPVLRKATHHVVHNRALGFWTLVQVSDRAGSSS
eukprot:SAG22_NODE_461_length_10216_cov_25.124543_4_plen_110_part_00